MKKIALALVLVIILVIVSCSFMACSKYTSSYSALMCVKSQHSSNGFINFDEFKGRYVFNFKYEGEGEGKIKYTASIGTGNVTVYYDSNDEKKELFKISDGQTLTATDGDIVKGHVYIIIESEDKVSSGSFEFELV